jgi:hypothetical protein
VALAWWPNRAVGVSLAVTYAPWSIAGTVLHTVEPVLTLTLAI